VKRIVGVGFIALIAVAVAGGLYAAAPPVTLKTTELGRGPALVFLHSLGSERMVWMPTARKLMGTHRVILVDLPGHKDTPLPDPFSIAACSEALDQVLAKQKPESTVIVAHGFGGLIALHEVQTHPDRARGLIVIDAAAKSTFKIPDQQQSYFLQMLDTNYDDILKQMFKGQGRDSLQNLEMYAIAQQVPPATIKAYLKTALNVDETAALKTMKPDFLFVASARIWPDTTDWATLSKRIGYDEAGHPIATRRIANSAAMIMKDQPDTLAAVIADFTAKAIAGKKK
jgi:pimeloyl-ACP methyl ester carboxylesterase